MPLFEVEVIRESYGFFKRTIEADTPEEAQKQALEKAIDAVIIDDEATYDVWDCYEVEP